MTTNILDLSDGIAVTDSRWSAVKGCWLLFIDNAGFEKIVTCSPYISVFAGDSWLIQRWKDWMGSGPGEAPPPIERQGTTLAVTVTDMAMGVVLFEHGQHVIEETARFAGSGAFHAHDHWKRTADPLGAVNFAISVDLFSGGEVKFYHFDTGETNLCDTIRLPELRLRLRKEGWMINTETKTPAVKIADVLGNAEALNAAIESIEKGETPLVAPDPAMYEPWTAEEKHRFTRLMEYIKKETAGERTCRPHPEDGPRSH
ncbi:MAG: hypothetical protein LBD67_02405 [Candidatus Accumulibacter sp.]|jgi:hypothetical protein|nr:hypothetical protein [Accumulibacter sp.]